MSNVEEYIKKTSDQMYYCEAFIMNNGDVFDAIPSHIYFIIDHVIESRDEVNKMIPNSASPVHWMVEHTGWIALWYDFSLADEISDEQMHSLVRLQESGRISNPYHIRIPKEKSVCRILESFDDEDFDSIMSMRKEYLLIDGHLTIPPHKGMR